MRSTLTRDVTSRQQHDIFGPSCLRDFGVRPGIRRLGPSRHQSLMESLNKAV